MNPTWRGLVWALLLACWLSACQSERPTPTHWTTRGQFGEARAYLAEGLPTKKSDRRYLLERMKLGVLTMADGYPQAAQQTFEEVYEILRTQGINRDKTVQSVVLNEDVKFWKGEPFEQALGFLYFGFQQASLGHWDNARAAAGNSLFQLKDFSGKRAGQIDTDAVARRAEAYERGQSAPQTPADHGYAPRESNFALGYLINGIANQQIGRVDEANDNFNAAVEFNPGLKSVVEDLRSGDYNTVLIVSFGLGPEKVAYGPDNSLMRFAPRTPSDGRQLLVQLGGQSKSYGQALDLNQMAADHLWNSFQEVRQIKSGLGTGLVLGGLGATAIGAGAHSREAVIAGLGAAAAGALLKAGAHADTAYSDAFPQRLYVVPLRLTRPDSVIELELQGYPFTRLALAGLHPPASGAAQLRYVSLLGAGYDSYGAPPAWATSGQIYYSNDASGPLGGAELPYILGGRSVHQPSPQTLELYKRSGFLVGMTPADLEELYRAEELRWQIEGEGTLIRHVLEGGRSLVPPLAGTTGFARLFGQLHPPYQPRTRAVQELAAQLKPQFDAQNGQSNHAPGSYAVGPAAPSAPERRAP